MLESEVESLVALVGRSVQVMKFFLVRHGTPLCVTGSVAPYIVGLREQVDYNITSEYTDKRTIASAIEWRIIYRDWSASRSRL